MPRISVALVCLALGLGLGGCAARTGMPNPASGMPDADATLASRTGNGAIGVIVALRPVPWRALGADLAAFEADVATTPVGAAQGYAEAVIRERNGRTRVVMAPLTAGLTPGREVRLVQGARLAVLVPVGG